LLQPTRMNRLEVVAPTAQIDDVIRGISRLDIAHFINITATKERKYKGITEEINPSERENFLHQLSNRIDNTMRKMGEIPYPAPMAVEGETAQVLTQIDGYLSGLESEIAKADNLMKEVEEERSSSEHEIHQFYEAYEGTKRLLADYGIDTSHIPKLGMEAFAKRERIRQLHIKLLNTQKTLSLVEIAGKLSSSHENVPNDEEELVRIQGSIKEVLALHQQLRETVPVATDKAEKIEAVLNEVMEVVEKKLNALENLKSMKAEAANLKGELEKLHSLSSEIIVLIGERFPKSIKKTEMVLGRLEALNLGSPEVGEVIKELSANAYEMRRGYEILENAERYPALDFVRSLIEGMKEGNPSEIKKLLDNADRILTKAKLKTFETVRHALNVLYLGHRIEELAKEPVKLKKMVEEKAKGVAAIHIHREVVDVELKIEDLKRRFRRTDKTTVFEVWVGEVDVESMVKAIRTASSSAEVNVSSEEETGDRAPTLMKHPKLAEWSMKLTRAYGLPNYHELDPTMIMFITFPILFGMMFGDLGHGLFIFIGAIFLNRIFEKFKLSGDLWDPILQGRIMIIFCGITAMVFGVLYGEFFGPLEHPNNIFYGTAIAETLEHYVWFNPLDTEHGGLLFLFKMSLTVGIIQVTFGIILDLINKLRMKEYKRALLPASWIWFYLSLSYLILSVLWWGMPVMDIMSKPELLVSFFIVPFAGMFVLHRITENSMDSVSETLTKVIESISNTLSYGRIMALAIAHTVFSTIAIMGSGIIFWPIFIMVTLLMIVALEGIITFAHTLRLHWVEWFGKYYQGDGIPYETFQIQRKFTT